MEDIILKIKDHSDNLIATLGFDGESIIVREGDTILVNIEVDTPALLIGRGGEGLESMQHILRLLSADVMRDSGLDLAVDVAGYRSKKAEALAREVRDKADQVIATGIEEYFPPMSAYERRIIHITCANIAEVETGSEGEGRERKVVIKPKKS